MRTARLGAMFVVAAVVLMLVPAPNSGAAVGPTATVSASLTYECDGVGFAIGLQNLVYSPTVSVSGPSEATPDQAYQVITTFTPNVIPLPQLPPFLNLTNAVGLLDIQGGPSSGIQATASVGNERATLTPFTLAVTAPGTTGARSYTPSRVRIFYNQNPYFDCRVTSGTPPTLTVNVVNVIGTTTTTLPGQTTTTTTTTTTTSTSSTTSPPTTQPAPTSTTTTVPNTTIPAPTKARLIAAVGDIDYKCSIRQGTVSFPDQLSEVTAAIVTPDKVPPGQPFPITIEMDPGPRNGPTGPYAPGKIRYTAKLRVSDGTTTQTIQTASKPNEVEIKASTVTPPEVWYNHVVPELPASVTAGAAGTTMTVTPDQLIIDIPGNTAATDATATCNPVEVEAFSVVQVVAGIVAVTTTSTTAPAPTTTRSSTFASCAAAKSAGRGIIPRTDPAYSAALDADGDGLACEATEGAQVAAASQTRSGTAVARTGTALARTGNSVAPTVRLGMVLLAIGIALLSFSETRRRRLVERG